MKTFMWFAVAVSLVAGGTLGMRRARVDDRAGPAALEYCGSIALAAGIFVFAVAIVELMIPGFTLDYAGFDAASSSWTEQ